MKVAAATSPPASATPGGSSDLPPSLSPPVEWVVANPRRILLAAAVVITVCSAPLFLRPFLNDDASFTIVAQKLNTGHLLYRDAVDNKPPLIYFTFAAILRLCGAANVIAIKVASVAVNLSCAVLVWSLGRRLFDDRVGGLAALLFALASVSGVSRDTIAPNTESFMNLFVLLSLWFLLRHLRRGSFGSAVGAGACAALATLYRLQGAAVLAGLAWLLLREAPPVGASALWWRRRGLAALAVLLGFLVPVLALAAYFRSRQALPDLWLWVIQANLRYVSSGDDEGVTLRKVGRIVGTLASQLPLLAAACAGGALAARRPPRERTSLGLLILEAVIGLVAYQMGKRFYGHYFSQVLPFAALLAAWALATRAGPVARLLQLIPFLAAAWAAAFLVFNAVDLAAPGDAPRMAAAAAELRLRTRDGDQLLLWGGSPLLTLWSGRDFATRFPFNNSLTGRVFGTAHSLAGATPAGNRHLEDPVAWQLFWRDLAERPPAVVVDGGVPNFGIDAYPALAAYVARHYTASMLQQTNNRYYFRRDSAEITPATHRQSP
ncbi:MAG: glycosyltransferase family 39 protein [Myxococcales bacterium]